MKLHKFCGERAVRSPGTRGNVTKIHRISYKPQIFADVVLQCIVGKYVLTCIYLCVRPHGAAVALGDY